MPQCIRKTKRGREFLLPSPLKWVVSLFASWKFEILINLTQTVSEYFGFNLVCHSCIYITMPFSNIKTSMIAHTCSANMKQNIVYICEQLLIVAFELSLKILVLSSCRRLESEKMNYSSLAVYLQCKQRRVSVDIYKLSLYFT
jgi:hypothetical protein